MQLPATRSARAHETIGRPAEVTQATAPPAPQRMSALSTSPFPEHPVSTFKPGGVSRWAHLEA